MQRNRSDWRQTGVLATSMVVDAGGFTVTGARHVVNQDRYLVDAARNMFVVADGMGGMQAGDRAAQMAVDLIPDRLASSGCGTADASMIKKTIQSAFLDVNQTICSQAQTDSQLAGMGTTAVLAWWIEDRLFIANVGDSRAYLVRDRGIQRITTDHTLAQMLVDSGSISANAARKHRFRHLLWKHLGSSEFRDGPDIHVVRFEPGDQIALVTDGVTEGLRDWEIATLMNCHATPDLTARTIAKAAIVRGTSDDVTCVVLQADRAFA